MWIFFSKEHMHEKKRGNTQELIDTILQFLVTSTSCEHYFSKRTYTEKRERKYIPKMEKAVEHAEPHIYIGNRKLQYSFNGI